MNNIKETERNQRKVFAGIVVSDKMQKTIVVSVERKQKHPLYKKLVIINKKYHVHDENEEAKINDRVEIIETRPLSKTKKYRLNKVLIKAK